MRAILVELGKGLKGRSTVQKVPVFGLLKRGGKVYVEVVP